MIRKPSLSFKNLGINSLLADNIGCKREPIVGPGMSANDRLKAQKRLKKWKQLGPERKKRIRERFKQFQKLSPSKRQALRRQREQFKHLPKEQRENFRKDWEHREGRRPGKHHKPGPGYDQAVKPPPNTNPDDPKPNPDVASR